MKVAFLTDAGNADGTLGGAELTMAEFKAAAPEHVTLTSDRPDATVIGNCVSYDERLISELPERVTWFHNDLSPHINPDLKAWLDEHATHVFCSPLHQQAYRWTGGEPRESHLVPPAIDLDRFKPTRQVKRNGNRKPMVALGSWHNAGKGQPSLFEYAEAHGPIDVYGAGGFVPTQPPLDYKGPVDPNKVPEILWQYERFVHLPWDVEPFGRAVVEAWAAGLELVVNRLVGARWWIEEQPEKLRTAAEDFWEIVCA